MAILYLHGFASTGQGSTKVQKLQTMFPAETVYSPTLGHDPDKAVKIAEQELRKAFSDGHNKVLILGTSLGGFYAWYLSAKFDVPAILINPVYSPKIIMKQFLGKNKNFSTGDEFEWLQQHIDTLEEYAEFAKNNTDKNLLTVIAARDDDLISHEEVIKHFADRATDIQVHDTGGHRFDDLEKIKQTVQDRLKTKPFESLFEDLI